MKTSKATPIHRAAFAMLRRAGVRAGVLSRNFPSFNNANLRYICDTKADYSGYGGMVPVNGKMVPVLLLNIAAIPDYKMLFATLAHEMIHIDQAKNKKPVDHGNEFRTKCAFFAQIIGCTYYDVMGYDSPSKKTARQIAEKVYNKLCRNMGKKTVSEDSPI